MSRAQNHLTPLQHINAFTTAFIRKTRRTRYLEFLSDQKKRPKILGRLNHNLTNDLKEKNISKYQPSNLNLLVQKEDLKVYLIADDRDLDGRFVPLSEALDILESSHFGIVISIIPGKLAAYKAESPSETIWLVRD